MINDKTFAKAINEKSFNCSVKNRLFGNTNSDKNCIPINELTDTEIIYELNEIFKNPVPRVGFIQYNKPGYKVKNGHVIELSIISEDCEVIFSKICKLSYLEKLSLNKTLLKKIPIDIVNLKHLLYIDLKKNNIQFIPEELYKLDNLQYLDVSYNRIQSFSAEKGNLPNLEILILDHNDLVKVHFSEDSCPKLRECCLDHNKIIEIQINSLRTLEYIALQNNCLKIMPNINDLSKLETLEMHYNCITEISTDFSNLQSLESISLSYNNISNMNFESIVNCKLNYLFINGNPLNKATKRKYNSFLKR